MKIYFLAEDVIRYYMAGPQTCFAGCIIADATAEKLRESDTMCVLHAWIVHLNVALTIIKQIVEASMNWRDRNWSARNYCKKIIFLRTEIFRSIPINNFRFYNNFFIFLAVSRLPMCNIAAPVRKFCLIPHIPVCVSTAGNTFFIRKSKWKTIANLVTKTWIFTHLKIIEI